VRAKIFLLEMRSALTFRLSCKAAEQIDLELYEVFVPEICVGRAPAAAFPKIRAGGCTVICWKNTIDDSGSRPRPRGLRQPRPCGWRAD